MNSIVSYLKRWCLKILVWYWDYDDSEEGIYQKIRLVNQFILRSKNTEGKDE